LLTSSACLENKDFRFADEAGRFFKIPYEPSNVDQRAVGAEQRVEVPVRQHNHDAAMAGLVVLSRKFFGRL
jgi:hypothetical protein